VVDKPAAPPSTGGCTVDMSRLPGYDPGGKNVFEGGDGNDTIVEDIEGTFNGGAGNDHVRRDVAGTFNGGPGSDKV